MVLLYETFEETKLGKEDGGKKHIENWRNRGCGKRCKNAGIKFPCLIKQGGGATQRSLHNQRMVE